MKFSGEAHCPDAPPGSILARRFRIVHFVRGRFDHAETRMKSIEAGLRPSRGGWRRALPPLCLFVGLPALLVTAFAVRMVFAVSMPWKTALLMSLHHWFVPFLVLVLGWGVARVFPIERGRRLGRGIGQLHRAARRRRETHLARDAGGV
jgi:hypothetical protein